MSGVKQEFSATGDDKVAEAYRKIAAENQKVLQKNAQLTEETRRLHDQVKKMAADLEQLTGRRMQQLEAEIRKTQDLKRARQELIVTTNWVYSRPDSRGLSPTTNWSYVPPPAPLRLGYRGDDSRGLVPARHPYFTMEPDADLPRLGYGKHNALSTYVNSPQSRVNLVDPVAAILQKQVGIAGKLLAGMVGVDTLIQAFQHQLEETINRQKNAAEAQKTLGQAQAEVLQNMVGESDEAKNKVLKQGLDLASETGLSPALTTLILGRQQSRQGGLTKDQVYQATRQAALLSRHTPDQFGPAAGGITGLADRTGGDADWASGLVTSLASNSYITDPRMAFTLSSQALAAGASSFDKPTRKTFEEMAEETAWITHAVAAEQSEAARTALLAKWSEQRQFGKGEGPWATTSRWGGKRSIPIKGFPTDPKDINEWFGRPENARHLKRFEEHFSARRQFEDVFVKSMMPGTKESLDLAAMRDKVSPDMAGKDKLINELVGFTPSIKTRTEANNTETRQTLADAGKTIQARMDEARDIRTKTLTTTSDHPNTMMEEMVNWLTRGIADTAGYGEIQDRALADLKARRRSPMLRAYEQSGDIEATTDAAYLDKQIKRLEEIRDEIRELRKGDSRKQPSVAPAMNGQMGWSNER